MKIHNTLSTEFYNTWNDVMNAINNLKNEQYIYIFEFISEVNPDINFIVSYERHWTSHFMCICTFYNGEIIWKNPELIWNT